MRTLRALEQVADTVWFVQGPASNWTILHTLDGTVLIDAGYPGDAPVVLDSVRATGADPSTIKRVFITHAHTDHIGGLPSILDKLPHVEVLAAEGGVEAVRGPDREQITVARAGTRMLRPRFTAWALGAIRAGGTQPVVLPAARAFTENDLTRAGLRAHPAPGHTAGSTAYEVVSKAILATGDAYITDHPTYARPRAGAIDAVFSSDDAAARATAAALPRGFTILPGHGPAERPAS